MAGFGFKSRFLAAVVALATSGIAVASPSTGQSAPKTAARPSVGIVVAVDESGSLSADDLAAEKRAASLVLKLPYSSLRVDAFGGLLGFSNSAHPICPPAVSDPLLSLPLASAEACVNQLARDGDTNHAEAIRVATAMLNGTTTKSADSKIMILMTDGGCDPNGTQVCDEAAVNTALQDAKDSGVQIWPVAFGTIDAKRAERMKQYADGGAGPNAKCPKAKVPAVIETDDPSQLSLKILDVISNSSCGVGVTASPSSLEVPVSPLLDTLVLQVINPGGFTREPVILNSEKKETACNDKVVSSDVITCTFVNPAPSGIWEIRAEGSIIVALQRGTVSLTVSECKSSDSTTAAIPEHPVVNAVASRPEVDWKSVREQDLALTLEGASSNAGGITLSRPDDSVGSWKTKTTAEKAGTSGDLLPVGKSESLPWLEVTSTPCKFSATAVVPKDDESSKSSTAFPWWLVAIIIVAILALIAFVLLRRHRKRMLPNSTIHVTNSVGQKAVPTYAMGALVWNLSIYWDGPTVSVVPASADIKISRDMATGRLRVEILGEEDTSAEFEREFPVVMGGSQMGMILIEAEDLSQIIDDDSSTLFGGGPEDQSSSSLFS